MNSKRGLDSILCHHTKKSRGNPLPLNLPLSLTYFGQKLDSIEFFSFTKMSMYFIDLSHLNSIHFIHLT